MSATTETNTETNKTAKTTKRVKYGFPLDFPQEFTLRDLRNLKGRKVKYITLYMRVKKALDSGEITISGEKTPAKARRGRKEFVYRRADAKTVVVSTANAEAVTV
jgi:hypothetical protein